MEKNEKQIMYQAGKRSERSVEKNSDTIAEKRPKRTGKSRQIIYLNK